MVLYTCFSKQNVCTVLLISWTWVVDLDTYTWSKLNPAVNRKGKKWLEGREHDREKRKRKGWSSKTNIFRSYRKFNNSVLQFTQKYRKIDTVSTSQNSRDASSKGMQHLNYVFPVILGQQLISCWALWESFGFLEDSRCSPAYFTDFVSRKWKR